MRALMMYCPGSQYLGTRVVLISWKVRNSDLSYFGTSLMSSSPARTCANIWPSKRLLGFPWLTVLALSKHGDSRFWLDNELVCNGKAFSNPISENYLRIRTPGGHCTIFILEKNLCLFLNYRLGSGTSNYHGLSVCFSLLLQREVTIRLYEGTVPK